MINSISFKSDNSSAFNDLIGRQQAYPKQKTVASSNIGKDSYENSKKKPPVLLIAAGIAAAGTIAAAVLTKNEKAAELALKHPKIGGAIEKYGKFVLDTASKVKGFFSKIANNAAKGAEEAAEFVDDGIKAAEEVVTEAVEANV